MTAQTTPGHGAPADEADAHTLTGRARRWLLRKLPPDKLLPEDQPSYVASWAYVFGMGAIASLLWIIVSGIVLGLNGPQWYHVSSLGSFVNSTHLWSVELFFIFMVVHLWLKFWMAAWRGGRALTWITGVISFVVSIVAAFTGYLLQTNFDSQWIAFEAKDALNAVGVGAWFNVANLGQLFTWHVTLLPLAVGAVVVLHVLLVRVHGVAPPLEAAESDAQLLHSGPEPADVAEPAEAPAAETSGTESGVTEPTFAQPTLTESSGAESSATEPRGAAQ